MTQQVCNSNWIRWRKKRKSWKQTLVWREQDLKSCFCRKKVHTLLHFIINVFLSLRKFYLCYGVCVVREAKLQLKLWFVFQPNWKSKMKIWINGNRRWRSWKRRWALCARRWKTSRQQQPCRNKPRGMRWIPSASIMSRRSPACSNYWEVGHFAHIVTPSAPHIILTFHRKLQNLQSIQDFAILRLGFRKYKNYILYWHPHS